MLEYYSTVCWNFRKTSKIRQGIDQQVQLNALHTNEAPPIKKRIRERDGSEDEGRVFTA